MHDVCLCGHHHETTRGWCDGRACRCRKFVARDPIELVAKRRRDLLEAADANLEKTRGYRVRKPAIVEDVEWMLSAGEQRAAIAGRIGMHEQSLLRAMRRHGRHDLADRLISDRDVPVTLQTSAVTHGKIRGNGTGRTPASADPPLTTTRPNRGGG